jgi:hypothetical protein
VAEPPDDPLCSICSKPIRPGAAVAFEHGDIFHLTCRTRVMTLRAMELREQTAETVARAAENLARATDTVERAKRLRNRYFPPRCPVCRRPISEGSGAIRQADTYVHVGCASDSAGAGDSSAAAAP